MLLEGTTSNLQQERSEEDTAYLQPFGCLLVLDVIVTPQNLLVLKIVLK